MKAIITWLFILGGWLIMSPAAVSAQPDNNILNSQRQKQRPNPQTQTPQQRPKLTKRLKLDPDRYMRDKQGRPIRIQFPLYDRVVFGAQAPLFLQNTARSWDQPAWRFFTDLSLALDFSDENVWWQMRHRLLDSTIVIQNPTSDQPIWLGEITLVQGAYLRHDLNSFITIPTLNDLRVPANFDIAVDYTLGRLQTTYDQDGLSLKRLELIDVGFLLDFIRDDDYRHRFAIGVMGWYHADTSGKDWKHELAPLSGLGALYGWDHKRGLFSLKTKGSCGIANHFDADNTNNQWLWRCRAQASMEWTPMTISDRPISVPLRVGLDAPLHDQQPTITTATIGIRWGLNLD